MVPVLILAYCRLHTLQQVLEAVKFQNAHSIYVSCDAPRQGDETKQREVLEFLEFQLRLGVIKKLHVREKNRGLAMAVLDGVSWFFEHEDFGLILEDDIVIIDGALQLVEIGGQLLQKDKTLNCLAIRNTVPVKFLSAETHIFRKSSLISSHGWATTSLKWNKFRKQALKNFELPTRHDLPKYLGLFPRLAFIEAMKNNMKKLDEETNSWDLYLQTYLFQMQGMNLNSNVNYVRYVGYGEGSSHHILPPRRKDIREIGDLRSGLKIGYADSISTSADKYRFKVEMRHTWLRFMVRKLGVNQVFSNRYNW